MRWLPAVRTVTGLHRVGHGLVERIQPNAYALVLWPPGGLVVGNESLQCRNQAAIHLCPLRGDQRLQGLHRSSSSARGCTSRVIDWASDSQLGAAPCRASRNGLPACR